MAFGSVNVGSDQGGSGDYVSTDQLGKAGGVATLDSSGQLSASQRWKIDSYTKAETDEKIKTEANAAVNAHNSSGEAHPDLRKSIVKESTPPGTVLYFATTEPPVGWLACNGAAVDRSTYAALFEAIGTTYGGGDGSATFNVPDLRDRVAWGGTAVGTVKTAGLPNITGNATHHYDEDYVIANGAYILGDKLGRFAMGSGFGGVEYYNSRFDASASNSIYGASSTVQPPALTLLPCIKY